MTRIDFLYDPFNEQSIIEIDNKPLTRNSRFFTYLNKNICNWIDVDIFEIFGNECNDDIEFVFKGIDEHYELLKKQWHNDENLCIELKSEKTDSLNDRLEAIRKIVDIAAVNVDENFNDVLLLDGDETENEKVIYIKEKKSELETRLKNNRDVLEEIIKNIETEKLEIEVEIPEIENVDDEIISDEKRNEIKLDETEIDKLVKNIREKGAAKLKNKNIAALPLRSYRSIENSLWNGIYAYFEELVTSEVKSVLITKLKDVRISEKHLDEMPGFDLNKYTNLGKWEVRRKYVSDEYKARSSYFPCEKKGRLNEKASLFVQNVVISILNEAYANSNKRYFSLSSEANYHSLNNFTSAIKEYIDDCIRYCNDGDFQESFCYVEDVISKWNLSVLFKEGLVSDEDAENFLNKVSDIKCNVIVDEVKIYREMPQVFEKQLQFVDNVNDGTALETKKLEGFIFDNLCIGFMEEVPNEMIRVILQNTSMEIEDTLNNEKKQVWLKEDALKWPCIDSYYQIKKAECNYLSDEDRREGEQEISDTKERILVAGKISDIAVDFFEMITIDFLNQLYENLPREITEGGLDRWDERRKEYEVEFTACFNQKIKNRIVEVYGEYIKACIEEIKTNCEAVKKIEEQKKVLTEKTQKFLEGRRRERECLEKQNLIDSLLKDVENLTAI